MCLCAWIGSPACQTGTAILNKFNITVQTTTYFSSRVLWQKSLLNETRKQGSYSENTCVKMLQTPCSVYKKRIALLLPYLTAIYIFNILLLLLESVCQGKETFSYKHRSVSGSCSFLNFIVFSHFSQSTNIVAGESAETTMPIKGILVDTLE